MSIMKVAVIFSGCGYLDGTEIQEAVLTLLSLDRLGIEVACFASDKNSAVKNHLTGDIVNEKRNILIESARITRGKISNLVEINSEDFAGIILPGGAGVAQNLSDIASKGKDAEIIPKLRNLLIDFWRVRKPIAAICISPALVTAVLSQYTKLAVTIGEDKNNLIVNFGGEHVICAADSYYYDEENNIFSTPAYMLDARLSKIAVGINLMVNAFVDKLNNNKLL